MERLTLLDYDDTLLATTFLLADAEGHPLRGDQPAWSFLLGPAALRYRVACSELDAAAAALVAGALSRGPVLLVTRATTDWVLRSAAALLPALTACLDRARVPLVSTQDKLVTARGLPAFFGARGPAGSGGSGGLDGVDAVGDMPADLEAARAAHDALGCGGRTRLLLVPESSPPAQLAATLRGAEQAFQLPSGLRI